MGRANIVWMDDGEHWSLGASHIVPRLAQITEIGRERVLLENLTCLEFSGLELNFVPTDGLKRRTARMFLILEK